MHETPQDLAELQQLLDQSHATAGQHLRSIFTEERRLSARELADVLTGVQVLSLATVTSDGRPRVAPVDGLFYRRKFYFGSSPDSVKFRHLRKRPHVSAAHVRGESLAVVVHGLAVEIPVDAPDHAGFRDYVLEVYGDEWLDWGAGAAYARIDPQKMFALAMPGALEADHP